MVLNDAGKMIEKWYRELENKYPNKMCHQMVIMPKHFHCIIENVRDDNNNVSGDNNNTSDNNNNVSDNNNNVSGDHVGMPLRGHPIRGRPIHGHPEHVTYGMGWDGK